MQKMKMVISASRRTDLPGCYYDWLQKALQTGEVIVTNPIYKGNESRVDLRPDSVHSLVLWSKDFRHVLKKPGYLENYNIYFQYTINNYSKLFEPNVPAYRETLATLDGLQKRYRPEQFTIRFDPVILSVGGEVAPTPNKIGQARLIVFENLCKDLRTLGFSGCRVTTSYITLYDHVKKRLAAAGGMLELNEEVQALLFSRMVEIASKYNLKLFSCASPLLERVKGINKGSCIDGQLLEELFGGRVSRAKDTGQRQSCGCSKSRDIGSYNQCCAFCCTYCYSNKRLVTRNN